MHLSLITIAKHRQLRLRLILSLTNNNQSISSISNKGLQPFRVSNGKAATWFFLFLVPQNRTNQHNYHSKDKTVELQTKNNKQSTSSCRDKKTTTTLIWWALQMEAILFGPAIWCHHRLREENIIKIHLISWVLLIVFTDLNPNMILFLELPLCHRRIAIVVT